MPYSASPPGLMSRLKITTSCPACAIFCAANNPAGPAPITKTVAIRYLDESSQSQGTKSLALGFYISGSAPYVFLLCQQPDRYHTITVTDKCDFNHLPSVASRFAGKPKKALDNSATNGHDAAVRHSQGHRRSYESFEAGGSGIIWDLLVGFRRMRQRSAGRGVSSTRNRLLRCG